MEEIGIQRMTFIFCIFQIIMDVNKKMNLQINFYRTIEYLKHFRFSRHHPGLPENAALLGKTIATFF